MSLASAGIDATQHAAVVASLRAPAFVVRRDVGSLGNREMIVQSGVLFWTFMLDLMGSSMLKSFNASCQRARLSGKRQKAPARERAPS